jgi:addiction module HigA family antidote
MRPGIVLSHLLEEYAVTHEDAARAMKVSRCTVSQIVNHRRTITPEMACRLERAFTQGPSAKAWLGMQMTQDLRRAQTLPSLRLVEKLTYGSK